MESARILVVEDEAITALDIRGRLQRLGYSVPAIASTGADAVRRVEETQPDLVLMDIRLQDGMDGIEAAEAIRARFDIPVIYLTAYTDEETVRRARLTEPFGYLLKPFEERELYTTIEMALHRHRSEVALRESERRLRLYSERLNILHEMDQAILAADSSGEIAQAALRRIGELMPCQRACIMTFDCEAAQVTVLAYYVDGEAQVSAQGALPMGQGGICVEMATGEPQVVEAVHPCTALPSLDGPSQAELPRFCLSVPLLNQDELIGALNLGAQEPDALTEEHIEIAREVANSLAIAIHHARLHEDVERHAAQLEARNRELDAFSHTVAHDIKDPLGLVIGFAEILERDCAEMPHDNMLEYLRVIWRSGVKMNSIVDELLFLAEVRKQEVQMQVLDMEDIVSQAQLRLAHIIKEQGAEIVVPENWPLAMGYGPWIEEVWVNYLSNAIKYGGQPPRVELGATELDGQVRFWVRDYGRGIAQEDQSQLFAPFTRLDQVRAEGHGLGLSIVRRIMEKLDGQVAVESPAVRGQGSVFSFTLPAVAGVVELQGS